MDFVRTVMEYRRMCSSIFGVENACEKCPLVQNGLDCNILENFSIPEKDVKKWVEIVEKWANENPRPHYPSYKEVIEDMLGMKISDFNMNDEVCDSVVNKLQVEPRPSKNDNFYSEWR